MIDEEIVPSLQDIHRDLTLLIDAVKDLTAAVHSHTSPLEVYLTDDKYDY